MHFARQALQKNFDLLLSAGGDGTLHEVVNGLLQGEEGGRLPTLGILPLGSGNDFARNFKIRRDADRILHALQHPRFTQVNVGTMACYDVNNNPIRKYFINVAEVGIGTVVIGQFLKNKKYVGGAMGYYLAILKSFLFYRPQSISIRTSEGNWEGPVLTFAAGIGKWFGGGLCIAPEAEWNDGRLSWFRCGNIRIWNFLGYTGRLKGGKKIDHPQVVYGKDASVYCDSASPQPVEADGEWVGYLPLTLGIHKRKLDFIYT